MKAKQSQENRILLLIRQTELEVGKNNEKRVVVAYTTDYPFPYRIPWLTGVRLATNSEDRLGIDLVFNTDVGEIYLQLKSSEERMREFLRRQHSGRYDWKIVVAVVKPSFDAREICKTITPVIAAERARRTPRLKLKTHAPG